MKNNNAAFITTVYQTRVIFRKILKTSPCSCLVWCLNIFEETVTSSRQTWIMYRLRVHPERNCAFQLCHTPLYVHGQTRWPAQSLFYTAAVFIYTLSAIQHFYTMTKCLDRASACNHSVDTCWKHHHKATTSKLRVNLTEMEGDFILSLALTAPVKTEMRSESLHRCLPLLVSVCSRRPSGCGEGSREVKVLDMGRGERVAGAKKRKNHFQIYNIVLCICFCPKQT